MKKRWLCLCLVGLLVLPGCGNKKTDVEDDFAQVTEADATNTDAATDSSEVPKHVDYIVETEAGTSKVVVNADVIAEGINGVDVYSAVTKKVDEDYVRTLASNVFDNGEYTVEQPYCAMDVTKIDGMYNEIEAQSEEFLWTYQTAQFEKLLERPELTQPCEFNSETMFYEGSMRDIYAMYGQGATGHFAISWDMEGVPGVSSEYIGYKAARISGMIDGKPCELSVKNIEDGWTAHVWLYSRDDMATFAKQYMNYETYTMNEKQQNPCDYSSALRTADAMIGKLMPDSDYRLTESYHRMVRTGLIDETEANGYRFCYTPCIKENVLSMNACNSFFLDESAGYNQQPMVCIDVDENGFLSAKFADDVALGDVITRNANLMSFNQLDKTVQLYMADATDNGFIGGTTEINQIVFSYVLIATDDGAAFVPCWLYYENDKGHENNPHTALFGINALDGTVFTYGSTNDNYIVVDDIY